MRTIGLTEARDIRKQVEQYSYTTVMLRHVLLKDRALIKLQTRVGHCGGTDYEDVGWVTRETADALKADGVYDLRLTDARVEEALKRNRE